MGFILYFRILEVGYVVSVKEAMSKCLNPNLDRLLIVQTILE